MASKSRRSSAHAPSGAGAGLRGAIQSANKKQPYKEVSNVSTADIERIIQQARDDGVAR